MLLLYMLITCQTTASIAFQYNMYETDGRHQDGYCLLYYVQDNIVQYYDPYIVAYQIIPYCYRPSEKNNLAENFNLNSTDDRRLTFSELQENNISSLLLLSWSSSIDLAERYEIFLNTVSNSTWLSSEKETLFYNCTFPWFGPLCRFAFDLGFHESFDNLVLSNFRMKRNVDQHAQITCYKHLDCKAPLLCLDWREICDGKVDCSDRSDELNCWELELNECTENEYRCYNGQCIPEEFLHDVFLNPDCLDGTDELPPRTTSSSCFQDPAFRCEEYTCRPGKDDFPCGDGQCTDGIVICENARNSVLFSDLCSRSTMCFMKKRDVSVIKWCQKFCRNDNCVRDNCPSLYQFLPSSILFGHIRLMFEDKFMEDTLSLIKPNYVCFDEKLCNGFLPPTIYLNNLTCLHFHELQIDASKLGPSLRAFIQLVKDQFRRCLVVFNEMLDCKHSTMYQCQNSIKCISKHRLLDGIGDCPFNDDETFNQSCSLSDAHHRFPCLVDSNKRCFSPIIIRDGMNETRTTK
jgi:hypothetical protein